jgi:uncharacterized protein
MKSTIKKRFTSLCFFLIASIVLPFGTVYAESLRLAANTVGSLMYAIGAGLAGAVEKHSSLRIEILPQGNVVAFPMFITDECDLMLSPTDEAHMAYRGLAVYDKMTRGQGIDSRMIMIGNEIQAGLLVAADSGIKTAQDLKGKRVTLDFGTHHALTMGAKASLIGLGLTEKDVVAVRTTEVPSGMRLVIEGKADACFGSIGVPAFQELQAARGALYLGLTSDPKVWEAVREIFHGYFPASVQPSKVAIGVNKPMILLGKNFSLISRANLDDNTAYVLAKTLWERDAELGTYHPRLRGWKKEAYVSTASPVPYHPGAVRFYKEVGAWSGEMQTHQDRLLALR